MANLLWTVCITQLAYMAPSSRLGDDGGHPRATVSTHWLNYMRVANGLISAGQKLYAAQPCCDTCHKIFFRQQTRNDRDTVDNPEFQNYVDNVHDPVIDPDSIFLIRIHPIAIISPNHNSNMPLTLLKNILKLYT